MSEFEKLGVVIKYEFLKHIRRKRLYIVLGLTLLAELAVIIGLPLLMDGFPDNVLVMAAMLSIGAGVATVGAVFFAGDAIAGEFESKTGFMLFTNPMKRVTLWIGKYLASCIAVIILVIFSYAVSSVALLAIYGDVPTETVESFGLCLLFAVSVISVTFFFSAVSKGAMGATVVTLLFIMVISGIIESVLLFAGKPYWFLLSTGGDSIAAAYGGYDVILGGMIPEGVQLPFEMETMDIGLTAIGMVIYVVVGFILSILISRRRQLA